jgi:hypothetical protein
LHLTCTCLLQITWFERRGNVELPAAGTPEEREKEVVELEERGEPAAQLHIARLPI